MDHPFPPQCRSRFAPVKVLASGGYGTVWLADQTGLGRPVVVKMLQQALPDLEECRQRFLAEARITAAISSPHVVIVVDHDVEDGVPWIAYEYLPGSTLRERVDRGPLALRPALVVAAQIAAALAAAHALGVVHRDIKPENVLEAGPDRWKVTDFGIARWTVGSRVQTRTGVVIGTPAYIAPEIVRGDPPSPRSDLYSLGIVLHELVAGRPSFTDPSPVRVLESHLRDAVPPLRRLVPRTPAEVEALVERLVVKDPAGREADGRGCPGLARTARPGRLRRGRGTGGPGAPSRSSNGPGPRSAGASDRLEHFQDRGRRQAAPGGNPGGCTPVRRPRTDGRTDGPGLPAGPEPLAGTRHAAGTDSAARGGGQSPCRCALISLRWVNKVAVRQTVTTSPRLADVGRAETLPTACGLFHDVGS